MDQGCGTNWETLAAAQPVDFTSPCGETVGLPAAPGVIEQFSRASDPQAARQHAPVASLRPGPVLLVTTCWWPTLARFAQLLARHGCTVALLSPPSHPGRVLTDVRLFEHSAFDPLRALSAAIGDSGASSVIPADDRSVNQLHRLHRQGTPAERALVERSLGAPEGFAVTGSRVAFIELARRLGCAVPDDTALPCTAALDAWTRAHPPPWVLKVDGAWGGGGVRVVHDRPAAQAAFAELKSWLNGAKSLKRLAVDRDPFWLADWLGRRRHRPGEARGPRVSVQAYIEGWPGDLAMLCLDGRVLAALCCEAVKVESERGPATIVRLVQRPELIDAARRIAAALGLNGFHGLDFVVEAATGRALLVELNPRLTPLANIRLDPRAGVARDLVAAAATLFSGMPCPPPERLPAGDLVAHFPTAQRADSHDARLTDCFQDIPVEDPALLAEMLRPIWPDRSLLARLLAALRRRSLAGHQRGGVLVDSRT